MPLRHRWSAASCRSCEYLNGPEGLLALACNSITLRVISRPEGNTRGSSLVSHFTPAPSAIP